MTPLLEFNLFTRTPCRTQKHVLLTRLPVYYRRINKTQEQLNGRCASSKVWGKDGEHPCPLWTCRSPQFSMCSPTWKLSKHSPLGYSDGFIIQAWFQPLTPLFPTGQGAGTESYIPLITWLVLTWQQAPILSWGSQSRLIGITMLHWHYIFWLHSLRKFQRF